MMRYIDHQFARIKGVPHLDIRTAGAEENTASWQEYQWFNGVSLVDGENDTAFGSIEATDACVVGFDHFIVAGWNGQTNWR